MNGIIIAHRKQIAIKMTHPYLISEFITDLTTFFTATNIDILAELSSIKMIFVASLGTFDPVIPIETPISAALNADAFFTPSRSWSKFIDVSLVINARTLLIVLSGDDVRIDVTL